MKRGKKLRAGVILVALLMAAWIAPPIIQKARHLCVLRPNGLGEVQAIPTFARRYSTSCTTCHAPVPIKINNFGQAFKNNGYRMPGGDENYVKVPDQELGAPAWKEMWPKEAVYPGALPSQVPLSFQIYLDGHVNPRDETSATTAKRAVRTWFRTPHEFELITGGTLGEGVSWWGNAEYFNDANQLEVVQSWVQFDHLLKNSLLNLKIGRLEPGVVAFSRVTRRSLATDFLASEFQPHGRHRFTDRQSGMELTGFKSVKETGGGFQYALGLVNGGGPTAANEANSSRDLYARAAYKYGGLGVAESLEESGKLKQTQSWQDDSLRVGFYRYQGVWGTPAQSYDFHRNGVDVDVWWRDLNLFGTLWRGEDDNVVGATKVAAKSYAYTLAADYVLLPWLMPLVRLEGARQQTITDAALPWADMRRRLVSGLVVGIRPNIVWITEFVLNQDKNKTTGVKQGDDLLRSRLRVIF